MESSVNVLGVSSSSVLGPINKPPLGACYTSAPLRNLTAPGQVENQPPVTPTCNAGKK